MRDISSQMREFFVEMFLLSLNKTWDIKINTFSPSCIQNNDYKASIASTYSYSSWVETNLIILHASFTLTEVCYSLIKMFPTSNKWNALEQAIIM